MENRTKSRTENRGYSLSKRPTNNGKDTIIYLKRNYRDSNGKSTSHIIKKLGLASKLGSQENIDKLASQAYEDWKKEIGKATVFLSEDIDCVNNEVQLGRFYILHIIRQLGLRDKLTSLKGESKEKYKFDFVKIVEELICTQILNPGSKSHMYDFMKSNSVKGDIEPHQIYRALDILAKHSAEINGYSYKRAKKYIQKESSIYYYDCTNFVYTQGCEGELLGMKKSKEGIFAPLVQMGLLIDENGFLIGMNIFKGNLSEQPSLKNQIKEISTVIPTANIIVCTDAGLCSFENKLLLSKNGRAYITTQPVLGKSVSAFIKDWVRRDANFVDSNNKSVKIEEIKKEYNKAVEEGDIQTIKALMSKTYYKDAWFELSVQKRKLISKPNEKEKYEISDIKYGDKIDENENVKYDVKYVAEKNSCKNVKGGKFYTRLLVSFSLKYYVYQMADLNKKREKALKLQEDSKSLNSIPKELQGLVKCDNVTEDGEVAKIKAVTIDEDAFKEYEDFAGFYVQATNLGDAPKDIYKVSRMRWQIEYCFRTMKTNLNCVPVYLKTKEHIIGHFTLVFLSLQILRTMMYKLYKEEGNDKEVLGRAENSIVTVDAVLEELRNLRGRELHANEGYDFYLGAKKNEMNILMTKAFGLSLTKQVIMKDKVENYVK